MAGADFGAGLAEEAEAFGGGELSLEVVAEDRQAVVVEVGGRSG